MPPVSSMTAGNGSAVYVGDLMRFSVELIRDFAEQPKFTSQLLRLREVRLEPDGTKVLVLDVVKR